MLKKWLFILIAVVQVGCAPISGPPNTEGHTPIAAHNWQQLDRALKNTAPQFLYMAIRQEARQVRFNKAASVESNTEVMAMLYDLLSHSTNPILLQNDEFNTLHKVVTGSEALTAGTFAISLADYLLNPDFSCKQPSYARYFQQRYYGDIVTSDRCHAEAPFYVITRYDGIQAIWIDPQRISSIHLLFAGEGEGIASRFGHVALRLVVCPIGEFTESTCNENLLEHLVIGFMAHIDGFELDTLKALSGNYKAYLFANQFMDVYQDYAISEFREVYSLPLRLNEQQREQMVRGLSEIHWRFSGDYNFFTRNCATLLQDALRILNPELFMSAAMTDTYIRPDHFFEVAKESTFTEGFKLESLETAEREGYYFSSTKPFYDKALSVVQSAMQETTYSDVESYLRLNPNARMDNIWQDNAYLARLKQDQYVFDAQLMLEGLAVIRSERLMLAEGARYFKQLGVVSKVEDIHAQLDVDQTRIFDDCLLVPITQVTEPVLRFSGIPNKLDILPTVSISAECHTIAGRKQLKDILEIINATDTEHWQRVVRASRYLEANISNVFFLQEL